MSICSPPRLAEMAAKTERIDASPNCPTLKPTASAAERIDAFLNRPTEIKVVMEQPRDPEEIKDLARRLDFSLPLSEVVAYNVGKTVTVRDATGCFRVTESAARRATAGRASANRRS